VCIGMGRMAGGVKFAPGQLLGKKNDLLPDGQKRITGWKKRGWNEEELVQNAKGVVMEPGN